ncbi:hypothetical protein QJQ45_008274 [Haematococcus lacustris]|nr:hypothetical protein QJQ45_008274 [Haematococcus lacustris]
MSSSGSSEAQEALRIILSDEAVFTQVVDSLFESLDINKNQGLDQRELQLYITQCCEDLGVKEPPSQEQVAHVFRHLDLNNDNSVNKDELSAFLLHLFQEQLRWAATRPG